MASKKKGLSIEEKVVKVEEWFAENPSPFTLKEILTLIPKAKGVIPQSIEECLEQLVSEGRVSSDKLGVSVMYWKFRTTASSPQSNGGGLEGKVKNLSREELTAQIALIEAQCAEQQAIVTRRSAEVETAEERASCDQAHKDLRGRIAAAKLHIAQFSDCDPSRLGELREAASSFQASANVWTDNIFLLEQYVCRRAGISSREFRLRFDIPADFDFL